MARMRRKRRYYGHRSNKNRQGVQQQGSINDPIQTSGSGIVNNQMDPGVRARLQNINKNMARGNFFNASKVAPDQYFSSLLKTSQDRNQSIASYQSLIRNNALFKKLYSFAIGHANPSDDGTIMLKSLVNKYWGTLTSEQITAITKALIDFAKTASTGGVVGARIQILNVDKMFGDRYKKDVSRQAKELFEGPSDWAKTTSSDNGDTFVNKHGSLVGGRVTIF